MTFSCLCEQTCIPREVVGKSVASVLHLQRSLPARIQSLSEDVQQARDVEGKRVVDVIEGSGVREEDIKFCQDAISQIQEHIFGQKMENLLQMVKECEAEFTRPREDIINACASRNCIYIFVMSLQKS